MIREADLVLAMSLRQVEMLRRRFTLPTGKVYTLPEYALGTSPEEGISEPYGHTITAFRASVRQLLDGVDGVVGASSGRERCFVERILQKATL